MSNELYRDFLDDRLDQIDGHIVDIINGGGIHPGPIPPSGHNYSTTEHVIGTWIDGSTLYEKSIIDYFVATGGPRTVTITHHIPNIDMICGIEMMNDVEGSMMSLDSALPYYTEFVSAGRNNVVYKTNIDGINRFVVITLRYTKTSI